MLEITDRLTLTVPEFAKATGVSTKTVRRWIASRAIKAVKIGGTMLIPVDAFRRKLGEATHHSTHHSGVP